MPGLDPADQIAKIMSQLFAGTIYPTFIDHILITEGTSQLIISPGPSDVAIPDTQPRSLPHLIIDVMVLLCAMAKPMSENESQVEYLYCRIGAMLLTAPNPKPVRSSTQTFARRYWERSPHLKKLLAEWYLNFIPAENIHI